MTPGQFGKEEFILIFFLLVFSLDSNEPLAPLFISLSKFNFWGWVCNNPNTLSCWLCRRVRGEGLKGGETARRHTANIKHLNEGWLGRGHGVNCIKKNGKENNFSKNRRWHQRRPKKTWRISCFAFLNIIIYMYWLSLREIGTMWEYIRVRWPVDRRCGTRKTPPPPSSTRRKKPEYCNGGKGYRE